MSVNIQTSDGLVKIAGTPTIDTSFSNISKNPVQNNVITQKFEQIDSQIRTQNSNLDTLEYSDVSGGKNYWSLGNTTATSTGFAWENKPLNLPSGTYTFSAYSDMAYELQLYDSSGNKLLSLANTELNKRWIKTFTISSNVVSASLYVHAGTVKDIQIEKGTTATDYEHYIPSVKMLADETEQINESLGNLNLFGNAIIGKRWNGVADSNRAQFKIKVNPNETYTLKVFDNPNSLSLYGFQSSDGADGISGTDISVENTLKITTKSNCKYLLLNISSSSTMTSDLVDSFKAMLIKGDTEPSKYNGFSGGNGVVAMDLSDINNTIGDLKNDLGSYKPKQYYGKSITIESSGMYLVTATAMGYGVMACTYIVYTDSNIIRHIEKVSSINLTLSESGNVITPSYTKNDIYFYVQRIANFWS